MTDIETKTTDSDQNEPDTGSADEMQDHYYRVRFREYGQEFTVQARISGLTHGDVVIARTDHGPEPAAIVGRAPGPTEPGMPRQVSYIVTRRATREEEEKYDRLPELEKEAFNICAEEIAKLDLPMQLIRVERFFNGSKIIFYFTAESRVDFRELVKNLVQEFRTRVEMRQIGVRHETQLIGGIGACGRELCCSSFLKKFESVSIKMAKTQDLPLNPAKISGLCNRLLCCLTYEYDSYRAIKREMPRIGKSILFQGKLYKVVRIMALQGAVQAISEDGEEVILSEKQWKTAEPVRKGSIKGKAA
ncbi:MAG: PSP1 domain-containing protein, partial [Desulfobulbales bacterium]